MNNYDWAAELLLAARPPFPASTTNIDNVTRWMAAEEPPSTWYRSNDPLNANNVFNNDIESFPDLQSAAVATALVIRQDNMRAIAEVLDRSGSLTDFSYACSVAPWSTGGYHGIPGYIASVPQPPVVTDPGTPPVPPPKPPAPKPLEIEMEFLAKSTEGNATLLYDTQSKTARGVSDSAAKLLIAIGIKSYGSTLDASVLSGFTRGSNWG